MEKTAFVTGATGFVGINLIRALCARGWHVRALRQPTADVGPLANLDIEWLDGEVSDRVAVFRAMPQRVDAVFHLAESASLWRADNDAQYMVNVVGTSHVVDAALWRRARRFVHTSCAAAFDPSDGDMLREETPSRAEGHWVGYLRTKRLGELEVQDAVRRGLNAVILNPGVILGPHALESRFLRLVAGASSLWMPSGSAPWAHIRSVVKAELAASEHGRAGHHYLLGSVAASYAEVARELHGLAGKVPPRPVPPAVLAVAGRLAEAASFVTRRAPEITPETAYLASMRYACDCAKASAELGYSETTLAEMVADTHAGATADGGQFGLSSRELHVVRADR